MFLSLTDYIQHKHAPGDPVANEFYRRIDDAFGRLAALGAVVALTADHGMNDKSTPEGKPNVIFCRTSSTRVRPGRHQGDLPDHRCVRRAPRGAGRFRARLVPRRQGDAAGDHRRWSGTCPGLPMALDKDEACRRFELPPDREGDVVVIGDIGTVIGAAAAEHDLSNLADARLRSHGAVTEARVPFILSRPVSAELTAACHAGPLKSYQIFDYAINGVRWRCR